jgi:hypothetical protein
MDVVIKKFIMESSSNASNKTSKIYILCNYSEGMGQVSQVPKHLFAEESTSLYLMKKKAKELQEQDQYRCWPSEWIYFLEPMNELIEVGSGLHSGELMDLDDSDIIYSTLQFSWDRKILP